MQTSPLNRLVYFCWAAGGKHVFDISVTLDVLQRGFIVPLQQTPLVYETDR